MDMKMESGQVTIGGSQLDQETFEAATKAGLGVCTSASSAFNRAAAVFSAAIRAPLQARIEILGESIGTMMAEIGALKLKNAALRQQQCDARPNTGTALQFKAPRCPAGHIEYLHLLQGPNEIIVCHLEYDAAERGARECGVPVEADRLADARLVAAYHRGGDVIRLLADHVVEQIEKDALAEVQS